MQRSRPGPFLRFQRLGAERRALLVRASLVLTAASAGVALLPFRRAIRFGCVDSGGRRTASGIERYVWAVEAAARRLPWRTMCIEKGLAVQRLLRSNGYDARLHYGARHGGSSGKLEAHVWVSVGGDVVIGGEEAPGFAVVQSYP